jgi:hypothetical protein
MRDDDMLFYQPHMTAKQAMLVCTVMASLFAKPGDVGDRLDEKAAWMASHFTPMEILDFLQLLSSMATDITRRQKEITDG